MAEYKIALVWIDIKNPMEPPLLGKILEGTQRKYLQRDNIRKKLEIIFSFMR